VRPQDSLRWFTAAKNLLYRRDYKVFMEGKPSNGIVNEIPAKIVERPQEYYIDTGNGLPRFFKTARGTF